MIRISQFLTAGLTVFSATAAMAECFYPETVKIPDGAASTYEEMLDSQTYVKEYMAEMETYLDCLEQENMAQPEESSNNPASESDSPYLQKRHAAIDAMESIAARFNEQVRAYKKVNP